MPVIQLKIGSICIEMKIKFCVTISDLPFEHFKTKIKNIWLSLKSITQYKRQTSVWNEVIRSVCGIANML